MGLCTAALILFNNKARRFDAGCLGAAIAGLVWIAVTLTYLINNDITKTRITQKQPATRGDTISLILEPIREHLCKISKPTTRI